MIPCLHDELAVLNKYTLVSLKQLNKPPNKLAFQQLMRIYLQQWATCDGQK